MKTENSKEINWLEIAKYNLIIGAGFAEAYACDKLTREEREAYDEYKAAYLKEALKDCPF